MVGCTESNNFHVANAFYSTYAGGADDAFLVRMSFGFQYAYRYWIPSASRASGPGAVSGAPIRVS